MAARKTTLQKAQATAIKAIRALEKSVSEMVSFEETPKSRTKAKKPKTKKARRG